MAPPNNPQVASVALITSRDGRLGVNNFHVTRTIPAALVDTDLPLIATAFHDWYTGNYKLDMNSTVGLDQIQVRKLDPGDPIAYDLSVAHETGTGPSPASPANVTAAVSWRTGLAGRKYRGRFFALGLPQAFVTAADLLTSVGQVHYALDGAALLLTLTNAGYQLVLFHRATNSWTKVITCIVDGIIDSQRRRLPGRGR